MWKTRALSLGIALVILAIFPLGQALAEPILTPGVSVGQQGSFNVFLFSNQPGVTFNLSELGIESNGGGGGNGTVSQITLPNGAVLNVFTPNGSNGNGNGNGVGAPVPEPASLMLLGSGLAGLGAWRRRKAAA